ncbi:MAG: SLBB domain-containing protein [Deltaproteobacteria bacterium]|nr:SLBB domain-containing protein [Deltaproteobacteria bacterium]
MQATAEQIHKIAQEHLQKQRAYEKVLHVCFGPGCLASGSKPAHEKLSAAVEREGLSRKVLLKKVGCMGLCGRGPLVVVGDDEVFYQGIGKRSVDDDVEMLVEYLKTGALAEKLLMDGPEKGKKYTHMSEVPFYSCQKKMVMEDVGRIDPDSIDEYLAAGGYTALRKALSMKPDDIIESVKKAGLRGKGGGGFLAATKWRSCRDAHGSPKYIMANGDEGDPGAFMDRALMEGNPHLVLEGMIIGAFAIAGGQGFIYVRDEYPLAVQRLVAATAEARRLGFLGEDICGSGFDFDIRIVRGGGAFVCGESTALMSSIEGKGGEPRAKYVHTVEHGLWNLPSNLNNVETWATVPHIINKGHEWFASIGTAGSKGTKAFSLVGKVQNTGIIEVPMGMTLKEIIFDLGGGIPKGRKFKAVQTGGPSGGCIPADHLDKPVDFDSLYDLGSMMGSGGMIVMDERDCMVDVARYFLKFLVEESCGKCVPCREGVRRMYEIVDRIASGQGRSGDLEHLEELGKAIQLGSLCGLGQSAPNPLLSTLRYFREEYEAHITKKKCPAGVCKPLIKFTVNEKCNGCMVCARECPTECISGEKQKPHVIEQDKCVRCGNCFEACRFDAVTIE